LEIQHAFLLTHSGYLKFLNGVKARFGSYRSGLCLFKAAWTVAVNTGNVVPWILAGF
jgi:hypothetical protein